MGEGALPALAGIMVLGMACQWLAWRVKLPAILFLLACGVLAGPVTHWLRPDALFDGLLFPFVSLAVAVILFEGSITLHREDIPGLGSVIGNLISVGALVTWGVVALSTRWLLGYPWELACLFGAIMVVTGPTVIVPLLRTVRPRESIAHVLRWEGILIDPIGATLAVLVYQFIVSESSGGGLAAGVAVFGKVLAIGLLFGSAAGWAFGQVLRRYWLPRYLHNVCTLALVCGVFALSNVLQAESGLLTVTVMGLWLANMHLVELEGILAFKESLSLLLISTLFIVLAARMDAKGFLSLGWGALGVFASIQFLARPIGAQLAAIGSKLTARERHLVAWIAPRGIVAAAISALFALKLSQAGYAQAPSMVPLAFFIICGTIALQSATAGPIARWLGVAEPEPRGFLIVGATPFALAVAVELQKNGFPVLLADQDWSLVRAAVMRGVPAYWGNPVSVDADRNLDLSGIGSLLALTPQSELNALAAHYYRTEFEPNRIFTIRNQQEATVKSLEKTRFKYGGRYLFEEGVTAADLDSLLRQGARIKTTTLTDEFSFDQYKAQDDEKRLPFFAITPNGGIRALASLSGTIPRAGWKIMALGGAGGEKTPAA